MSNIPVKVRIGAIDKLSSTLDRVKNKFPQMDNAVKRSSTHFKIYQMRTEKFRKSMDKVGKGMKNVGSKMTMGLTLPIAGFAAYGLKASADFTSGMAELAAKLGKPQEEIDVLSQKAQHLGRTTQFSASEALAAMIDLAKKGFSTEQIDGMTGSILNLAGAQKTELAAASNTAAGVIRSYGFELTKLTNVTDIITQATNKSGLGFEDFSENFTKAGSVASKNNVKFKELTTVLGKLADENQKEGAGRAVKAFITKLAAPAAAQKKVFTELGIARKDMFSEDGKFKGLINAFELLGKKGATTGQLVKIFGQNFVGQAQILTAVGAKTKDAAGSFGELSNKLNNATGAAKENNDANLKGLNGSMKLFKSALEGVGLLFKKLGFEETISNLVKSIADLLSWFGGLSIGIQKTVFVFGGLLAAAGPLLVVFGIFLTTIPGLVTLYGILTAGTIGVTTATAGMTAATAGFGATLSAAIWPITLIVAGITALIGIGYLLVKHWDSVKSIMLSVWDSPITKIALFMTGITQIIWVVKKMAPAFKAVASAIGDFFSGVLSKGKQLFSEFTGWISKMTSSLENGIREAASFLPDSVANFILGDPSEKENGVVANGAAAGASQVQKNIIESRKTEKSLIGLDISGAPQGTKMSTEGPMTGLDFSMGYQGAL